MTIDWTPLADLIETHDRFLVTTHVRPDGDALGSEVGMAGLLRQRGKDVRVVNSSPTPPRYDFLDPDLNLFEHFGHRVEPAELADREVVVILDLSSWNQLGDMAGFIRQFSGPRVVIDHHVSEDDLGATVFKDSSAEATGILVMKAIAALGCRLYTGRRRRSVDRDRNGYRLVSALQHASRDAASRRRADRCRCASRRHLPQTLREKHDGSSKAHRRDARGVANGYGRKNRLRHDFPR